MNMWPERSLVGSLERPAPPKKSLKLFDTLGILTARASMREKPAMTIIETKSIQSRTVGALELGTPKGDCSWPLVRDFAEFEARGLLDKTLTFILSLMILRFA